VKHHYAKLLGTAAAIALCAGPAFAQEDEIVVTATKRAQSLQDVPFSVNAQTADDMQRTGSQNLEDISRNVAGLSIQNLGPGQSQVGIRGVSAGQIVRDQPGVKEQVGVYLDESVISLSLFTPDLDLFDLNRVETLRGPQGTLFGSGSIGGTIRYITNQPKLGEVEGLIEGNFNIVDGGSEGGHGKGMINVPLGDKAAFRGVVYWTEYAGFIDAFREGGGFDKDVNDGKRYGGRFSVRWEPTENIAITPRFVYQDVDVNGFNRQEVFNLFGNTFTTTRPTVDFKDRQQYLLRDEQFRDQTTIGDLTVEIDLGSVDFTSITTRVDRSILVDRDASSLGGSVFVDLGLPDAAVLIPEALKDRTELGTWTQEARLASDYADSRLQWLIGGFWSQVDRDYSQRLPTPGIDAFIDVSGVLPPGVTAADIANGFPADSPFNSDLPYDIKQYAIFTENTLELTDQVKLTAGVRYYNFDETRTISSGGLFANGDSGVVDTTSSDGFTPRFILSYEVSDSLTLNAQAAKGFRLGGVNDPLNTPICTPEDLTIFGGFQDYEDETLWNYEGGAKYRSGGLTANVSGFYNDIKNLQTTLDAGTCSSRITFNVPKAHSYGVEWEIGYQIPQGLEFSVAGSWLNSEFDSTVVDGNGNVLAGLREGNRLASVPKFQIAATAQYNFVVASYDAYIAASFQHVGSRFTQPADQESNPRVFAHGLPFGGMTGAETTTVDLELPDYQILNINAGLNLDKWDLLVYVNNLTDENALLAFDRERGGRARLGFHVNQPRTFGVTARYRF
jgi:iron complex outermembrane receptor protein